MNRIQERFIILKKENRKALISFLTAGDPNLDATKRIVKEMEKRGADIIEIGIPYSDPIAEGPVIQEANKRALANGLKIKDVMEAVAELRKDVTVPLVYLLYLNCILQYGPERFFSDCKKSGIDAVIIPDLPYEEKDEIEGTALEYSIDVITLVSPTSKDRIERIAKDARGFLYCVSSLGVTGVRKDFNTDFDEFFSFVNKATNIPKALGFGISTVEHVEQLKGYSDGLIIGSAIVRKIAESPNVDEAVNNVGDYISSLREALDS